VIDAALADVHAALAVTPNSTRALRWLARAQLARSDVAAARETLQKARAADPRDAETALVYAQFLNQTGDPDGAIATLQEFLRETPGHLGATEMLIRSHALKSDWKGALAVADAVKKAAPDQAHGDYFAGLVYQQKKDHANAIRQFEQALKKTPDAIEPLTALVRSYIARNQPARAVQRIRQILKIHPQFALAQNLLGEVYLVQKRTADAEAAFTKALEADNKLVAAYRNLAAVQVAKGSMAEAVRVYQRGIDATLGDASLRFALATLHERQDEPEPAAALYEQILKREPGHMAAINNLAMLLVVTSTDAAQLERAKKLADRLKASANPAFLDTAGWVYYKRGEYDDAVAYLEKAVQGLPKVPVLHYHLGMAAAAKGDAAAARAHLEEALKGRADFPGADEARAELARIKGK
jgi:tetratricopeptide (TPR) repeat protein